MTRSPRNADRAPRRSFLRCRKGASAVEFALVAPVFFALTFAILEAGFFFFVNSTVTEANARAARLVRTGQAQLGGITPQAFYNEICNVVDALGSCDDRLTVDVDSFPDFAALAADLSQIDCRASSDPTIAGSQFSAADYGARREIVRVRVCFLYKPVNPFIGLKLQSNADGFREMVSVSIFRNEPFGNNGGGT